MGARTAFRLATIRNKAFSNQFFTPISINGAQRTGFSTANIHCGSCIQPLINEEFRCQSCAMILQRDIPGTIYMGSASTTTVSNRGDIGDCFLLGIRYILCVSCSRSVIVGNAPCGSCLGVHVQNSSVFVSLFRKPCSSMPSTEASIRDLFTDEIREYDN